MNTKIIEQKHRDKWDNYVLNNPDAVAWQGYGWSEVVARRYPVEFLPIVATEDGVYRGVLPLYRVRAGSKRQTLISVPYAVAGGIAFDSESAAQALLDKAIEFGRQFGCENIVFKQYKVAIPGDLKKDENFYNRELDITGGKDAIWENLADRNRRKIENAEGMDFIFEPSWKDRQAFYELLIGHLHRQGIPCPSQAWIEDLLTSSMYSMAVLKINGRPAAATMTKQYKKTVSFPYSCCDKESNQQSLYLLYWKLIQHFMNAGMEIIHSGRIPNNDDTDEYRLGWGGTKYPYFYQYYPPTTTSTEHSVKRGRKREIAKAAWKRLPLGLTRRLGPRIVSHFP